MDPLFVAAQLALLVGNAKSRPLTKFELGELLYIQDTAERERLELGRKVRALEKVDTEAEQLLIDQIRKGSVLNVQCGGLTASLTGPKYKPHVQEWDKFYAYILKEEDFSLLERRPAAKAIAERWDDNQVIPGVEKFPIFSLSKTRS